MLKESIKRKLIITTFALIIFFVTMSFPKTEEEIKNVTISYQSENTTPIYLLDSTSFVVRTNLHVKSEEKIAKAKEILSILTIGSKDSIYIPTIFEPIIPENTKVLGLTFQDKTIKINFSKELLTIPKGYEEKLIECIVYSLTQLPDVTSILIFVENNLLEELPNSHKKLPPLLTKDIGINKTYHLNSLKNVSKTTAYYIAKEDNISYYVPVTLLENNDKEKVEIIIERLKTLPSERTNLISYLNASTELSHYEVLESEVILSFSPLLYEGLASEEILEEVKYAISLSIEDTLQKETIFKE